MGFFIICLFCLFWFFLFFVFCFYFFIYFCFVFVFVARNSGHLSNGIIRGFLVKTKLRSCKDDVFSEMLSGKFVCNCSQQVKVYDMAVYKEKGKTANNRWEKTNDYGLIYR